MSTATAGAVDVLVVSLGATGGLRSSDTELCESLRQAGAHVVQASAARPTEVRTFALTDLLWAIAARKAAIRAIERHKPRAVIYSTITAALLWPRPGAIRFDSLAAANRPGRHGLWQRRLEQVRLSRAAMLLPCAEGSLQGAPDALRRDARTVVVPIPVEPSDADANDLRDIAAITYAANPLKKGLDRVLAAWQRVRRADEQLVIAGAPEAELRAAGIELPAEGVRLTGMIDQAQYRTLLRRARVFVCAPRREDYGIAQLEALADGCMLVTNAAPGPYAALPIAQALDGRLVGEDLGAALRAALDRPLADYAPRAQQALLPWRRQEVDRVIASQVLPGLRA